MKNHPQETRLNILMIVADDHRHDCLHGDRINGPATPVLDQLAARGTEFTGARIMGGDTQAVCVPSRAALHTGCGSRRALATPHSENFLERQCITKDRTLLGEVLGQAGYRTHAVGKWHNDPASLNRSFASGDALLMGGMSDHENPPLHTYDPSGQYDTANAKPGDGFSTELFANAAIDFVETTKAGDAPFFLYCAFTSPHDPRTPPADFRERYNDEQLALPANFLPQHPFDNGELSVRDELLESTPRDPAAVRRHRGDYYGMIEHHDHHIGRMIDALERNGQRDNTIIVYVSDHGLALGSHGLMGKQNLYEHSVRVPLIMSGPGIPTGDVVSHDVYSHRLLATLCGLASVPLPATVDEPSLWSGDDSEYHFAHYYDQQRMVKNGRWKLIRYDIGEQAREQLFDLETDPYELTDLIDDPHAQKHRAQLNAALEEWWARYV